MSALSKAISFQFYSYSEERRYKVQEYFSNSAVINTNYLYTNLKRFNYGEIIQEC